VSTRRTEESKGRIDLVGNSREPNLGGITERAIGDPCQELASNIESKVVADREKDRAMLPVLRRTLEEK
jgi:hypothetical protein